MKQSDIWKFPYPSSDCALWLVIISPTSLCAESHPLIEAFMRAIV